MSHPNSIIYKSTKSFSPSDLERLFLSVNWQSEKYPDKLATAIENYKTVFTAWDGDKLIGLISAMDDTVMTAYIHYLLVDPEYQKLGVGRMLVEMIKIHYADYLKIALIAEADAIRFYERCGFELCKTADPMYISKL